MGAVAAGHLAYAAEVLAPALWAAYRGGQALTFAGMVPGRGL